MQQVPRICNAPPQAPSRPYPTAYWDVCEYVLEVAGAANLYPIDTERGRLALLLLCCWDLTESCYGLFFSRGGLGLLRVLSNSKKKRNGWWVGVGPIYLYLQVRSLLRYLPPHRSRSHPPRFPVVLGEIHTTISIITECFCPALAPTSYTRQR